MGGTTDRYINLFTDFGFKKLFGEEPNKDLLISFLNSLFQGKESVENLHYLKNERLGAEEGERRAVYDLYCENEKGEKFIVEIQRVKQEYFKDRSIYYSTFAIQEQALKGKSWNYELKSVYTVAILDFEFDDTQKAQLHHSVKLIEEKTCEVFYDKLNFIYLEIPKFNKPIEALENDFERWLFAFKNLHRLREMPSQLEEGVFKKLFDLAEILKMDSAERSVYANSLKDYWDLKSAIDTATKDGYSEGYHSGVRQGRQEGMKKGIKEGREKGMEEGREKGIKEGQENTQKEMALNALEEGLNVELVAKLTGLSIEEVKKLRS